MENDILMEIVSANSHDPTTPSVNLMLSVTKIDTLKSYNHNLQVYMEREWGYNKNKQARGGA